MSPRVENTPRLEAARRVWGLSPRQLSVLELLLTGASNKEIANALQCAEVTVENHLTSLYRRSGARSRTDLVCRVLTHAAFVATPEGGA
jgi:DNA-binding NarL/FixJ family response regulator